MTPELYSILLTTDSKTVNSRLSDIEKDCRDQRSRPLISRFFHRISVGIFQVFGQISGQGFGERQNP